MLVTKVGWDIEQEQCNFFTDAGIKTEAFLIRMTSENAIKLQQNVDTFIDYIKAYLNVQHNELFAMQGKLDLY